MIEDTSEVQKKSQLQKACCGNCDYILGLTNREEYRIKYKDLYVSFYGGLVIITCKGCSSPNYVVDDEYAKFHPEQMTKVKNMLNIQKARFKIWIGQEAYDKNKGVKSHVQ